MLRTDRKTETTKQTQKEEQQRQQALRKQRTENAADPSAALEAILAGGSWDQLPAESVLGLSGMIGNAALAELIAARETGPATAEFPLPAGACGTAPVQWGGGMPAMTGSPAFGAMAPIGGAPLAV